MKDNEILPSYSSVQESDEIARIKTIIIKSQTIYDNDLILKLDKYGQKLNFKSVIAKTKVANDLFKFISNKPFSLLRNILEKCRFDDYNLNIFDKYIEKLYELQLYGWQLMLVILFIILYFCILKILYPLLFTFIIVPFISLIFVFIYIPILTLFSILSYPFRFYEIRYYEIEI